jgi:hypothetical protein
MCEVILSYGHHAVTRSQEGVFLVKIQEGPKNLSSSAQKEYFFKKKENSQNA